MARPSRAELIILGVAILAAAVAIGLRFSTDRPGPKIVVHPLVTQYRPQPDRTFFWGANVTNTFSAAQRAKLVAPAMWW